MYAEMSALNKLYLMQTQFCPNTQYQTVYPGLSSERFNSGIVNLLMILIAL